MNVLVLSGANHGFDQSAGLIRGFLDAQADISVDLSADKDLLAGGMDPYDVCVFGTGFTRTVKREDGSIAREPDLTPAQEDGVFEFVSGGKGLVGIHGSAWWIGGRAADLLGGHANWHPPGLTFTVRVEDETHPAMEGIQDFEVDDEIYISAYEPRLQILASAQWHGGTFPVVWVKNVRIGAGLLHGAWPRPRDVREAPGPGDAQPGCALGRRLNVRGRRTRPGAAAKTAGCRLDRIRLRGTFNSGLAGKEESKCWS